MIITVGQAELIGAALGAVSALLASPTIALRADPGVQARRTTARAAVGLGRKWRLGEADGPQLEAARHGGHPLHRVLVSRLRQAGVLGAVSLRGVWGFHGDHPPHGDRLLAMVRHVPVVTVIVDEPERIDLAFDVVDDVTADSELVA